MSERPVDLDELFDRDADSRLLDRRRRDELGLAPRPTTSSSTPARFGAETIVEELASYHRPALLRVTLIARPEDALIPGTTVTVVAEIHVEGDAPVVGALARLIVSAEAEPVPGSFARDDTPVEGELLLGEGVQLPPIPAGGSIRLRCTLRVLPGTAPLTIDVFAGAAGVPTIAPPALRLARRAGHAAYATARPFFELEAGEVDEALGSPAPAVGATRLIDAVVDEPALPPSVAAPKALTAPPLVPAPPPAPAPATPVPIAPAPVPIAVEPVPIAVPPAAPARSEHVLRRLVEPDEARALDRIFSGAMPHGLANLTLLCSIAACDGTAGEALGLGAFTRAVAAALPRAMVAARMGRPVPAVVDPAALALIRPAAEAEPDLAPIGSPLLTLRLDQRELDALRAMLARTLDDPFLRGAQVLLGIIPRAVDGIVPADATPVREALDRYRGAAAGWLVRATVRRKVDRRFDPLTADDAPLFAAGHALVRALHEALG